MPATLPSMRGVATLVTLPQLAGLIYRDNHHFEEIVACSTRHNPAYTKGSQLRRWLYMDTVIGYRCPVKGCRQHRSFDQVQRLVSDALICPKHFEAMIPKHDRVENPYWGCHVEKVYDVLCRNNFSFPNTVDRALGRPATIGERKWGRHLVGVKSNRVPHNPFVIHRHKSDGRLRLHLHLLHTQFNEMPGETGWYVDNEKVSDALVQRWVRPRTGAKDEEERVKNEFFPIGTRLENVRYAKIAGNWYRLKAATDDEAEILAEQAAQWAETQVLEHV